MSFNRSKAAMLVVAAVVSITAVVQAAVNEMDRRRLDAIKAVHEKEIEQAKEIYERATTRANEKLRRAYEATIKSYEARGDQETAGELKKELEEIAGPEAPAATAKKPGHLKLIQAIGPVVQDASKSNHDSRRLASNDYMLIYFSAQWCPPCRAFTPKLIEFVNTRRTNDNFNLVFVSNDRNEAAMFTYMSDFKMPWVAVPYSRVKASGLQEMYGGRGIPNLVLVDREGKAISTSYRDGTYVGPSAVLNDLAKLLDAGNATARAD
jgi:thiol-disulfide isomerase/thioredoxin